MHVISRKALREFWEQHPDSKSSLTRWANAMEKTDFNSFSQLKQAMPTADLVGDLMVFNIGGNKYRLMASIHFNRGKVYVRQILTHRDYDKGGWKL
jgi:mRNA interferase HigB